MKKIKLIPHPKSASPIADKLYSNCFEYYSEPAEEMLCLLFTKCNFNCAWCRRNKTQGKYFKFISEHQLYSLQEIIDAYKKEAQNNSRLYFTGGEPSLFVNNCLEIAREINNQFYKKISYAHNGSSPKFVEKIAPFTYSAAIDLKGVNPLEFSYRAGVRINVVSKFIKNWIEVQKLLTLYHILADIRMPIFKETPLNDMKKCVELVISTGTNKKVLTFRVFHPLPRLNWEAPQINDLQNNVRLLSKDFPELPIGIMTDFGVARKLTLFQNGNIIPLSPYKIKEAYS